MFRWLAYPFSVVYYVFFCLTLLIFHPLQVFAFHTFGIGAQKKTVDALNWLLLRYLNMLGTRIDFDLPRNLPIGPIAFVANHQSTYDIPPLIWYLRKLHPKFVAKKELGNGIPSISYHLQHGGNILIDRKKPKEAKAAIISFCERVVKNNWSIVIFAEGTRSRSAQPKKFQRGGLRTLLEQIPNLTFVPVSISHSWKLAQWNYFPMPLGIHITLKVHPPIEREIDDESYIDQVEKTVVEGVKT